MQVTTIPAISEEERDKLRSKAGLTPAGLTGRQAKQLHDQREGQHFARLDDQIADAMSVFED